MGGIGQNILREAKEDLEIETHLLIYQTETDGNTIIEKLDSQAIKEKVKNMHYSDYAIISGNIIKNFDSKIDLNKL